MERHLKKSNEELSFLRKKKKAYKRIQTIIFFKFN